MNIHIIELKYLVDEASVAKVRPAHREFLSQGYELGYFLASGPKEDGTGGVILAKGDIKKIMELIESDPFATNNIAKYRVNSKK